MANRNFVPETQKIDYNNIFDVDQNDQSVDNFDLSGLDKASETLIDSEFQDGFDLSGLDQNNNELERRYEEQKDLNPDTEALKNRLELATDEDPSYIDKNHEDLKKNIDVPDPQTFQDLNDNYPKTKAFLLRKNNMALAKDDLPNLNFFERQARNWKQGYRSGILQEQLASIRMAQMQESLMTGQAPTSYLKEADQLEQSISYIERDPMETDFLYRGAQVLPYFLGAGRKAFERGVQTGTLFAMGGGIMSGGTLSAPAFLAGMGAGSTMGAAEYTAFMEASNAFGEFINLTGSDGKPINPRKAVAASLLVGAANAGLEMVSLKAFSKLFPFVGEALKPFEKDNKLLQQMTKGASFKDVMKKYLTSIGTEVATESAQEIVTGAGAQALQGEVDAKKLALRSTDVMYPALQASVFLGAIPSAFNLAEQNRRVKQADADRALYSALGENAQNSKLRERLPEAHRELVDTVTKDGPIENVYIPLEAFETYFQSNADTVATQLGITDQLNSSRKTGQDIQIPLSSWTNQMVGTEHYQNLANDVKFDQSSYTANELIKVKEENDQAIIREQEIAQREIDKSLEKQKGYDLVYDYYTNALHDAGYTSASEIDANAKLQAAHAVAESTRQGKTVEEWFQGINKPEITRAEGKFAGDLKQSKLSRKEYKNNLDLFTANSVVKTSAGKPKKVFHGSDSKFSQFQFNDSGKNGSMFGEGFYFTDSRDWAEAYGPKMYEVYLNLENPFNFGERTLTEQQIKDLIIQAPNPEATLENFGEVQREGLDNVINKAVKIFSESQANDVELISMLGRDIYQGDWTNFYQKVKDITGHDGVIFKPDEKKNSYSYVAFSPNQIKSVENLGTFDPKNPDIYYQGEEPRASVRLDENKSIIRIFKAKDFSSMSHESSHIWLQDVQNFVQSGKANESYLSDWQKIKDFLGIKNDNEKITTEQQEKFADAFENYLREGKSPSESLRGVFAQFKKWLTKIYRNIKNIGGIEINDDIRQVFDRLVATEDEINEAIEKKNFLSNLDERNFPQEIVNKLNYLRGKAREHAEEILLKEQMKELTEQRRKEVQDERIRITEKVKGELINNPYYQSLIAIEQDFPNEKTKTLARKFLNWKLTYEQETKFIAIAELSGFKSGDELAKEILSNPSFDEAVNIQVNEHMAQYMGMMTTGEIKQKALDAVVNSYSTEGLIVEKEALKELINNELGRIEKRKISRDQNRIQMAIMKESARDILSKLNVKELQRTGTVYFTAERNAAVKAARAMEKGNYEEALRFKEQQTLNHVLAREANKFRREVDKNINFLHSEQIAKRDSYRKNSHFEQAAAILKRFGFTRNDFQLDTREISLSDWAKTMEEQTNMVDIPDFILQERFGFQEYRSLTIEQLGYVSDAIKNIKKIAMMEDKVTTILGKSDLNQLAKELLERQKEGVKKGNKEKTTMYKSWFQDKASKINNAYELELMNTETLLKVLDHGETFGPWWSALYKPINDATSNKIDMMFDVTKKYRDILGVYSDKELKEMNNKLIHLNAEGEIFESLTKSEILGMALNWGNEVNRQRLISKKGWSESQVETVFKNRMTKKDWTFVQNTLDLVDSYWPQIAKLHEEITGFAPKKVDPKIIHTPYGDYKGGYYPLIRDSRLDVVGMKEQVSEEALRIGQAPLYKAATKQNHTKERAATASYHVSLNINNTTKHLVDVIHDLTFRKAIIDTGKILRHPDVVSAITDAYGMEGYKTLDNWQREQAGYTSHSNVGSFEKLYDKMRRGVVISAMALRVPVLTQQLSGYISTATVDKNYKNIDSVYALGNYLKIAFTNPSKLNDLADFIYSKSSFMKDRANNFDRDLSRSMQDRFELEGKYQRSLMASMRFMANIVEHSTWNQAYLKALQLYNQNEAKAIDYADMIIRRSQGSSFDKDLAPILKQKGVMKSFTMFYSWMNAQLNLLHESNQQFKYDKNIEDYMGKLIALTVITPLAGELLAARLPLGDDDDPEKQFKWVVSKILQYNLGQIPVIRDFANSYIDIIVQGKSFGYRSTPINSIGESGERMLYALTKEDKDIVDQIEAVSKFASLTVPYPDQFNVWLFNAIDVLSGNSEFSGTDILRRKKKENR